MIKARSTQPEAIKIGAAASHIERAITMLQVVYNQEPRPANTSAARKLSQAIALLHAAASTLEDLDVKVRAAS